MRPGACLKMPQHNPRRYFVAETEAFRHQRQITCCGIRRIHHRQLTRRSCQRHVNRLAAEQRADTIGYRQCAQLERAQGIHGQRRRHTVGERALGDHPRHLRIASAGNQYMAATKGTAPQRHAAAVDLWQVTGVINCRLPVLQLLADVEQLPRFPIAAAEVPVVEHQAGIAGLDKPLCIGLQAHFLDAAQPVGHDNHWCLAGSSAFGQKRPATTGLPG